ncbi:SH3 domain-containing protein [Desulfomonile tiedjei]|uniref:SH3 domain-containing protein n=1 Tax=Desulfomonile tiedjei (strain ATCC 49306 / DSM 6799 / DCB-1) TaxID=706587 RepID=I4CAI4_DESTA|nr:SH3 domain-containing protein [Desulfomonile tiedjei]AFM26575.1 SH3 domain-containing protein [Desulfomonile tiedjei DSM 6799]
MIVEYLIITLQIAVVAAFLLLWYYWVRKKFTASFLLEDNEQVLFPFRYFSWIFIGLIVAVALVQIHFVRVSASVHDQFASLSGLLLKHEQEAQALEDLRRSVAKLRHEVESNFKSLRAQTADQYALIKYMEASGTTKMASANAEKDPLMSMRGPSAALAPKDRFANEARAYSAPKPLEPAPEKTEDTKVYSMRLSRTGRATTDSLRVRKQPQADSPIIDQLSVGQEVKVTEKRASNEQVWFRIVTPGGKAGWVDVRYLKLEGNM